MTSTLVAMGVRPMTLYFLFALPPGALAQLGAMTGKPEGMMKRSYGMAAVHIVR